MLSCVALTNLMWPGSGRLLDRRQHGFRRKANTRWVRRGCTGRWATEQLPDGRQYVAGESGSACSGERATLSAQSVGAGSSTQAETGDAGRHRVCDQATDRLASPEAAAERRPATYGVLADAGYGVDTAFRHGLSQPGLPYRLGITSAISG